jgi:hypothetical protein
LDGAANLTPDLRAANVRKQRRPTGLFYQKNDFSGNRLTGRHTYMGIKPDFRINHREKLKKWQGLLLYKIVVRGA